MSLTPQALAESWASRVWPAALALQLPMWSEAMLATGPQWQGWCAGPLAWRQETFYLWMPATPQLVVPPVRGRWLPVRGSWQEPRYRRLESSFAREPRLGGGRQQCLTWGAQQPAAAVEWWRLLPAVELSRSMTLPGFAGWLQPLEWFAARMWPFAGTRPVDWTEPLSPAWWGAAPRQVPVPSASTRRVQTWMVATRGQSWRGRGGQRASSGVTRKRAKEGE